MKRTEISKIHADSDGYAKSGEITVAGWVRTLRDSKNYGFIDLNDGSSFVGIQVVFDNSLPNFKEVAKLNVGSSVVVCGQVTLTPEMKQPFELKASSIEIEGESLPEYPLQKKRHSLEFLREIAHLRPRTNTFNAVFRVRSAAAKSIHDFFESRGFTYVHTPIITASDAEGAGEMFRVTTLDLTDVPISEGKVNFGEDFFGKEASLSVSGQLEAESLAHALGNVYTFGPTFRAENSNTPRHAAEFWMIEPEMAFAELSDNMEVAESMIKYVIGDVLRKCPDEMAFFSEFVDKGLLERLKNIVSSDFGVVTYTEAVERLEASGADFEYPVYWGCDLQTEHERYITEKLFEKPVFVINYPKEIKAFYMRLNEDGKTVAAMDLLVPGVGEIIGGSQREERYDVLKSKIEDMGFDLADYDWYLDLRKYGTTKHSGFGLGFERLIMYLTGVSNIRDVIPFARTVGNCEF